ncbi:WD40 repeat-like protein [Irpex rosettiformis]|uniref:WD40 repeat-like protein n=1 Tax=Irpex rosettiformis TaxID=378272 RepID=A0ACB8UBR7_9APHY|nr:WD40 repeat-like protein [Irpex rosettiformis]
MQLQELVLCATQPTNTTAGPGTISLHDIQTGSTLASFKQTSAGLHSTAVVNTRDGQGGFMLAAQPDKSILNVYHFQKDQLALKIILPEKVSCIAADPKGTYCAAGTAQGRVYLWEVASGIMYHAWDAHYRQVSVLRFTQDGTALLSGSEDSGVSVWAITRLLDDAVQNELPTPYYTLSDHTLPVTDIVCGVGLFPKCRVLTSSMDHSVKAWDLSTGTLLTTFQFPRPISCLAWDVTERLFLAASADGSIHQVNLFRQRDDKLSRVLEAVGGGGPTDVIRMTDEDQEAAKKRLISVKQPITTMTISLSSSLILVGTETGLIHVYDIASHQLLRSISTHKGFSITHLSTMLKPPDLIGHVSLSLSASGPLDSRESIPVRPVATFQRVRDPKAREAHEVTMMLSPSSTKTPEAFFSYDTEEAMRDYSVFVQSPNSDSQATGVSLQSRVIELEEEVQKLRDQLGKAKSINDTMWDTVVRKVIIDGTVKERDSDSAMEVDGDGKVNER